TLHASDSPFAPGECQAGGGFNPAELESVIVRQRAAADIDAVPQRAPLAQRFHATAITEGKKSIGAESTVIVGELRIVAYPHGDAADRKCGVDFRLMLAEVIRNPTVPEIRLRPRQRILQTQVRDEAAVAVRFDALSEEHSSLESK